MKNEEQYCILSVKYSILECHGEKEELKNTTKMEHVFTARDKSTLLKKIQKFEDRLRERHSKEKSNLMNKATLCVSNFIDRYRSSYQSLLRM